MRLQWEREINLTGALLAGSIWMLAAVLAWPLSRPSVAVGILAGQAVAYIALAVLGGLGIPGAPRRNPRRDDSSGW